MEGLKLLITAGAILASTSAFADDNNQAMKHCMNVVGYDRTASVEDRLAGVDWAAAAKCYHAYNSKIQAQQIASLREFLAANPRYTFPGQSRNSCWGKPREMPFESATLSAGPWGFTAGVSYKDTMPAGCYETGSWDNREGRHDYDG
jgi:hypothetical protein